MERGLGIGGNYDSNLRLPWCCLYKTQVMAHQSSVMRAAVTRLTPETYPAPEPENKTEEKIRLYIQVVMIFCERLASFLTKRFG